MVRYVHLPGAAVDTALLEDATRRGRRAPIELRPEKRSVLIDLTQRPLHRHPRNEDYPPTCMKSTFLIKVRVRDEPTAIRSLSDMFRSA